jgi:hypothetical protein
MRTFGLPRAALAFAPAALLVVSACQNNNTVAVPTTPTPTVTDTFTGTITKNGAETKTFSTAAGGQVNAALTTLTPSSGVVVGFSLGTWNGSACQVILANDQAVQGASLLAVASGAGSYCLRMYDSTGNLAQATDYSVQIVHP